MKNLVIVESPAKAKTIEKYLGKDFTVMSSVGHIRQIAKKNKEGGRPIEPQNKYKMTFEVDSSKKKVVAELRKAVKAADEVWLATDEDREGEAIAWHLCEVLKLNPATTKRIVFHEITKNAITEAIQNPRTVDMKMVEAQQTRQTLDWLVGFDLSPVVWRKVPGGKSAGRVQSPAVRLLVEREQEISNFEGKSSFKVTGEFVVPASGEILKAELNKKFPSEKKATEFLESLKNANFEVESVSKTPGKRNPSAPFTTSTLQQEANSRLGMSAKSTMAAAQKLYQSGKITYMRTDSVNLSKFALATSAEFIKEKFGEKYHKIRNFATKSASAQEAHEAIRPTDVKLERASSSQDLQRVYDLIRSRTLASQMAPAEIEKTTIKINFGDSKLFFESKGEVVVFPGFLAVYSSGKRDEFLPNLKHGDRLTSTEITAKEVFARPPARYSEGSLVKKLEDLGIGRPSTYATIIDTIQARGYVEKGESEGKERDAIQLKLNDSKEISKEILREKSGSTKGKLVPTPSGEVLSGFLTDHFNQVVDYNWTANLENDFDKIAVGDAERIKVLDDFYNPFHKLILNSGEIDRNQVAPARELGIDPKSGKPVFARFGRFGPMIQIGDNKIEGEEVKFAAMPAGEKIETVTLEDALKMFALPRIVGRLESGEEIKANIGRFGPYIQVGNTFVSIKPMSPFDISEEEARMLYDDKLKADAKRVLAEFDGGKIKVSRGGFGRKYISDGEVKGLLPKDIDVEKMTDELAIKLIEAAKTKKSGKKPASKKRASSKKATVKRTTVKKTTRKTSKK